MPGKVKVRIIAGRNLPVMDKSSDTSDAFVEVCFAFEKKKKFKTLNMFEIFI